MRKLLVCDLDGTLLDQHNAMDAYSRQAIMNFIQAGNDFCICTGRLDADIQYVEKKLGFQSAYRISQNGAVIRDRHNNLIFSATIAPELIRPINRILFSSGLRVEVSDINHRYFLSPRDPGSVAEYVDTSVIKPDLQSFVENSEMQPVIYLTFGTQDAFVPLTKQLKDAVNGRANVQQTSPSSLEVFSNQASKGQALRKIMGLTHYAPADVYAAGDAENDTSMFTVTDHSFAIGRLADQATIAAASAHYDTVGQMIDSIRRGCRVS
ncbi:MAG: HAD hydrolase family protein [Schleiferilactobacillus perolens]|uniref:HAD hydrolase family protein n=1 Tax=Schleiferilactobacillus perolens TaxID=100468 RepID=UPI0039EB33BB